MFCTYKHNSGVKDHVCLCACKPTATSRAASSCSGHFPFPHHKNLNGR